MSSESISFRNVCSKFIVLHGREILVNYVQVPIGLIIILILAYLVELGIQRLPFTFPSSAVLMIILFIFLILIEHFLPLKFSKFIHTSLNPSSTWVLNHMGLFFTSSFITIPRRDEMPPKEIGLLFALFPTSFLITWIATVSISKSLPLLFDILKLNPKSNPPNQKSQSDLEEQSPNPTQAQINLSHPPDLELTTNATFTNDPLQTPNRADHHLKDPSSKPIRSSLLQTILKIFKPTPRDSSKSREDLWIERLRTWFDPMVYLLIFLIGLPLFFSPDGHKRSLPLFLGTVSLAWIFSRRVIPSAWQRFLHPILLTSAITILVIWALGAIKGFTLPDVLVHYSTGSTYLILFRRDQGFNGMSSGAGDLLSSILIAGIVCLAFPLFKYRQDLYSNFSKIFIILFLNSGLSILLWPWLAKLLGINGSRAITFAARFMSTPFGIEFIQATGGDESLVVVLICVTGILAVLVRDYLFKFLKVPTQIGSDDYFTIGITIGVIAGAIGTSSLLHTHPRAAATATVSFVIYGLILLSLVAVPTIAQFLRSLSGL